MVLLAKCYLAGHCSLLSRSLQSLCNTSSHVLLITILLISVNICQIGGISTTIPEDINTFGAANGSLFETTVSIETEKHHAIPCYNSSSMILLADISCKNNGTCFLINDEPKCQCFNSYFTGTNCGILNLKLPTIDVFETGIKFQWPNSFYIANNYGLFTRTPLTSDSKISMLKIESGFTNTITITGLEPDAKEYLLCIIHSDYLGIVNGTVNQTFIIANGLMKSEYLNCGIVLTPYDVFGPYTIAAWSIGIVIGASMLLAIMCRACCNCRDKPKREKMIAEVMGILRKSSSKRRTETNNSPDVVKDKDNV